MYINNENSFGEINTFDQRSVLNECNDFSFRSSSQPELFSSGVNDTAALRISAPIAKWKAEGIGAGT